MGGNGGHPVPSPQCGSARAVPRAQQQKPRRDDGRAGRGEADEDAERTPAGRPCSKAQTDVDAALASLPAPAFPRPRVRARGSGVLSKSTCAASFSENGFRGRFWESEAGPPPSCSEAWSWPLEKDPFRESKFRFRRSTDFRRERSPKTLS
jgi:hypothetical protein